MGVENNYDETQNNKKKRVSSSSMESGNTDIMDSSEHYQLDDDLYAKRLSITEKTEVEEEEEDTTASDTRIPSLLVPQSMKELRDIDDPMSTFDDGDDNDIEMQKQQMQQAEQEQQQQSCLSPKSIIFAGVGIAVIFGAIYAVIKMRNNHNQLFD